MLKLDIVFMAAGMSSRFGGDPKILCKVGFNNETILELNIIQLKKYINPTNIHFICNSKTYNIILEEANRVCKKHKITTDITYNIQEIPHYRKKPLGTTDALVSAINYINNPVLILNSDDIYGENTFKQISDNCNTENNYIIGFKLGNTFITNNKANRGFISLMDNKIIKLEEKLNIAKEDYTDEELNNQYVSVNLLILQPSVINHMKDMMTVFIKKNKTNETIEALLPNFINQLLNENKIDIELLDSNSKWLGVTYQSDIPIVKSLLY